MMELYGLNLTLYVMICKYMVSKIIIQYFNAMLCRITLCLCGPETFSSHPLSRIRKPLTDSLRLILMLFRIHSPITSYAKTLSSLLHLSQVRGL